MKDFAICAIARNENKYIEEFCEHYFSLGFDKIYLMDNWQNSNDERLIYLEYIQKMVTNGKIYLVECNTVGQQYIWYDSVIAKYKNDFEWLLFVDIDEFLILENHNNIKEYVSQSCFDDAQIIYFNWKCYGACGHVFYKNAPVKERFLYPSEHCAEHQNKHNKCMIRGGFKENAVMATPHSVMYDLNFNGNYAFSDHAYNAIGEHIENPGPFVNSISNSIIWKGAWINHYYTKSFEEWITNKCTKGLADSAQIRDIDNFFLVHEKNEINLYVLKTLKTLIEHKKQ